MSEDRQVDTKLTFVLTLALSGTGRDDQDLQRFRLLLQTFRRFFDPDDLFEFVVVAPPGDLSRIRDVLESFICSAKASILDEQEICPELKTDPPTFGRWPKPNKGWYRQQLIKLAIHEYVTTHFYMTLDSDVIFTRPFSLSNLIRDGKALLNIQREPDFRKLYRDDISEKEIQIRKARYQEVEKILRTPRQPRYENQWYGETPVMLSTELVGLLVERIEQDWQRPWRQVLLENLPWTEYALYFSFAEQMGSLDTFYLPGNRDTLLSLSNSLWRSAEEYREPRNLGNWCASRAFEVNAESVAVVVQSYLNYSVGDVYNKIGSFVGDAKA